MQPDPTRPPASDWPLEHPWLHIYAVLTTMLLGFLAIAYLLDWLKETVPKLLWHLF